jgi:hypothetical protein
MAKVHAEIGTTSSIEDGVSDQELVDRFVSNGDEAAFATLGEHQRLTQCRTRVPPQSRISGRILLQVQ